MLPSRPPLASHPASSPAFSRSGRAPPPTRRVPGSKHELDSWPARRRRLARPALGRARSCPTTPGAGTRAGGEQGDPRLSGRQARHLPACAVRRPQCACPARPERSQTQTRARRPEPEKSRRAESAERMAKEKEDMEQEFQTKGTGREERGSRDNTVVASEFSTLKVSTLFRKVMRHEDKHLAGKECRRDGRMQKEERWHGGRNRRTWTGASPASTLISLTGKHLNP
ncbi:uncharacterized protein LOC132531151 [Lagenorhynchus albirostris]|uniref:uncharacterized protein LOC132531151 n=1 Tax=Lagenorhynchus albirostris TaxID=27610 RepID=UPI0028F0B608|nr:uncharacterized protein LOC132531151 [Lagenorhynchus albirostris]